MPKFSCKDCVKRKVGCHSTCQAYQQELEEFHKIKEMQRLEEVNDRRVTQRRFDLRHRQLKKYGKAKV